MIKTLRGKVYGKTIQLDEDLGLPEGQEVELQVRLVPKSPLKPGEGILRTAGALANDKEWDAIMDEIYRARKMERGRQPPQPGES